MRVVRVVDDHRTTETITVLGRQVTVIPERASLVGNSKVVEERVPRSDRALVHEGWSIGPVSSLLKESMPVLYVYDD